jgi:CheY-like chemotaxis protein
VICDTAGGLYPALTHYSEEIELVNTQDLDAAIQEVKQCPVHALLLNNERIDDSWLLAERASRQLPGTAIIGCAVPRLVPPAVAAGACGYLTKPITRWALEQALRRLQIPLQRILLVDDEPEVLQLLTRMLHSYDSALKVVTALTATEALSALRLDRPDLVLLDIRLPDLSGWQVLATMRQNEALNDVPVLFVSAHDPTEQPLTSPFLLATTNQGISISKLLNGSLGISALLLQPD